MKKILLLLLATNCFAQPAIDWKKCYGGSLDERGFSVQGTSDGGFIFVGASSSNDGQISVGLGNTDAWVVKTNSSGAIQWEKTFGGSNEDYAHYIEQTTDGGYILTGTTLSNNNDFTDNHGLRDLFVIKLNSAGGVEWKKCYGGTAREYGEEIHQTSDGGYIVFGRSSSHDGDIQAHIGLYDFWLVKLNASGTLQWEKTYGGIYDELAFSAKETADHGFILSGYTDSIDGDAVGNHSGLYDCLIIKTNSLGAVQWKKVIGGVNEDYCYGIIEDTDGNFIASGYTDSVDGDIPPNNAGGLDGLLFKLSPLGNIVWVKTFGNNLDNVFINCLQTSDGNYIAGGMYNGLFFSSTNSQSWLLKLDTNGNSIWENLSGGSNNDEFLRLSLAADNSILCIGQTNSNDIDVSGNHGGYDFWVMKFLPEQLSNSAFNQNNFSIYPNPTAEILNINLTNDLSIDKIVITDCLGKTVFQENTHSNQININNLANGVYIIEAFSGENKYLSKFIKK